MTDRPQPLVSVVIPTRGRPHLLQQCLEALSKQTLHPEGYEVLVVDDGPDYTTRFNVEQSRTEGSRRTRYLQTAGGKGPGAARNIGWRSAFGDVIAFTDDDCLPERSWLESGLRALRGDVCGASGRILVPLDARPTDYQRNAANLEGAVFTTANCFYRRCALEAVDGFDERFTMAWREDADLYLTLLERGANLVSAPDAVVVHPVRPAPWGVSVYQQRKSRFNALLYRKHRRLYRQHIQPSAPWHYYASVSALGAWTAGLLFRHRELRHAAGTIWLILSGQFLAHRLRGTSRSPSHVVEMFLTSLLIPPLAVFWRLQGAASYRVPFV